MNLGAFLAAAKGEVEAALERILPPAGDPLSDAMRYSTLAGGKRLRPVLALAVHDVLGGSQSPRGEVTEAAAALELVHTYSLIHDDLPCMDDDALRRGKPTCHVVHGEAMALLAGDALQSLGFEILASRPSGAASAAPRAEAVLLLARAIGAGGMAGGQALDLAASGHGREGLRTAERLKEIHEKKTGRLLAASCELGAVLAGASVEKRDAAGGSATPSEFCSRSPTTSSTSLRLRRSSERASARTRRRRSSPTSPSSVSKEPWPRGRRPWRGPSTGRESWRGPLAFSRRWPSTPDTGTADRISSKAV
ncbi:MAG: polyprenyl synthetase family protein [Holophagales bacterium]|nr:polyprenyl synthetase family protein [Holophagales bacterium]